MQVLTQDHPIEIVGQKAKQRFQVANSVHMMNALSALYRNIPLAVTREYLTNMWDAYQALSPAERAARPQPILHLPTKLEPYIEFKDFGVGMSFERVWDVFTVFGESTKTGTNTEVGGFGFGSKTAFCYTDSWTIESRYNGQLFAFSAIRDVDGAPTLVHFATTETTEPNGVTVRIPVKEQQFYAFIAAATTLVPYFGMPLTVLGASIQPFTYTLRGTNWGLRENNCTKVTVVMGNVPYTLDEYEEPLGHWQFRHHHIGRNRALDIWVPIGSVDIVPSRDDLQSTERTTRLLRDIKETIVREQLEQLAALVAPAPTRWEATKLLHAAWPDCTHDVPWRGTTISLDEPFTVKHEVLFEAGARLIWFGNSGTAKAVTRANESKLLLQLNAPDTHRVLVCDEDSPMVSRTIRRMLREELGPGRMSSGRSRYVAQHVLVWPGHTPAEASALLDGVPVTGVDALPVYPKATPKPRAKRPKNAPVPVQLYRCCVDYAKAEHVEVDVHAGGWFMRFEKGDPKGMWWNELRVLWMAAQELGVVAADAVLYGIPRSRATIEHKPGWQDFVATIKAQAPKRLKAAFTRRPLGIELVNGGFGLWPWLRHNTDVLATSSKADVRALGALLDQAIREREGYETLVGAEEVLKLTIPRPTSRRLARAVAQFRKRYAWLGLVEHQQHLHSVQASVVYSYLGIPQENNR